MHAYIARRILEAIPLILLVLVMNFIILHIAPGDPVFLFNERPCSKLQGIKT
jgi:ABC-type microcin C transport system permease subunit YejB